MLSPSKDNKYDRLFNKNTFITITSNIPKNSSYDKDLESLFIKREYSLKGNNFIPNKPIPNDSWKSRLEKRIQESFTKLKIETPSFR